MTPNDEDPLIMRLSAFFLPTLRETPSRTGMISHALMLRAGMIHQESAGIYSWLPLGLRVLEKITAIICREQEKIGALKILMPMIQSADIWQESGRWDSYGPEMLRCEDRHQHSILFGPTNEEMVTAIARDYLKSYRQLPLLLYQVQWKFRDEIRPRFGVMRAREFLMKDAYSFSLDAAGSAKIYRDMFDVYRQTFAAMGLKSLAVRAPSGPIGGGLSHEFHILAPTGESVLYYDRRLEDPSVSVEQAMTYYAVEEDMHDASASSVAQEALEKAGSKTAPLDQVNLEKAPLEQVNLKQANGIEIGHIFAFGEKYSRPMNLRVGGASGEVITPHMGSYGMGISRLPAAVIEASHDDRGIIWPERLAPFHVGLVDLSASDGTCSALCEDIYTRMRQNHVDILYDDRSVRAGVKLADMDLIGLPWRVAVGKRHAGDGLVEVQRRGTKEMMVLSVEAMMQRILGTSKKSGEESGKASGEESGKTSGKGSDKG